MLATKFLLDPADGRKSFYGKCYVIKLGNFYTLYSYDTVISEYNAATGELRKTSFSGYSQTTKRHEKAFNLFIKNL